MSASDCQGLPAVSHGARPLQVFPAEPFNAEIDRMEDQGRGGWKGSQVKPALLPKDVDKSNTTFRCVTVTSRMRIQVCL